MESNDMYWQQWEKRLFRPGITSGMYAKKWRLNWRTGWQNDAAPGRNIAIQVKG